MKKIIAALMCALLGISLATPASAAITAGAKCANVGEEKISKGKTLVCTKSGTKLLWQESKNRQSSSGLPGGFETNKTYSTDIGYNHKFSSPQSLDPGTPPEWKAMERKYIGEKIGYRFKKYQLGQQRPKASVTSKSELLAPETCKILDGTGDDFLRGFPSSNMESEALKRGSYPKPKLTIQVVPIFAEDTAKPVKTPEEEYGKYFNFVKNWIV
jgi:hypothetical protein